MKNQGMIVLLGICFLFANWAQAALPQKQVLLETAGVRHGGVAGAGFTLLDARLTQDKKKKIDRIVFDIGDQNGQILRGKPGYFHVELKDKPQRLVIDLAQIPQTKVDEKQLAAALKKSFAVTQTGMTMDPTDNSLSISLGLKKNTKVRVLQVAGKKQTSKLVIDLIQ